MQNRERSRKFGQIFNLFHRWYNSLFVYRFHRENLKYFTMTFISIILCLLKMLIFESTLV